MAVPKRHSAHLAAAIVAAITSACSLLLEDGYSGVEQPLPPAEDAGEPDGSVPASTTDAADAAPAVKRRPDEGVYPYVATGKDSISLGSSASYGPTASVEVLHTDADCFTAKVTLRAGYVEETDYCVRGAETIRTGVRRWQHFSVLGGVDVSTVMTCQPGDPMTTTSPAPVQEWAHFCNGRNVESETGTSDFTSGGSHRFVGEEDIVVGGVPVPSRHFREELVVSGLQQGTNVVDWYFTVDGGVLVRLVRKVSIRFPKAFNVEYSEEADLTLVTMTPSPLLRDAGADAAND